jgi:hypothetical protein
MLNFGFRGFAHSRIRGFAHSRIRGFAHSRIRGFAHSRFRGFAVSPTVLSRLYRHICHVCYPRSFIPSVPKMFDSNFRYDRLRCD